MATGKRHPLLIYTRLYRAWGSPALLIALLCGLLWWLAPPPLDGFAPQAALLAGAIAAGLLFLYALLAPRLSYVQCRPTHLRVSTPLFRLAISYSRIRSTRPVQFHPTLLRPGRRWIAEPFLGKTALALDLTRYPIKPKWLRLAFNEFVFPGDFMGLLFMTTDWMALSRDIDVHRATWKSPRRGKGREAPLTSMSPRGH